MGAAVGTAGRRSERRAAPAVSRSASHPPALPVGQAQEIPNAQARAEIPCRAGPQAQHSASHPPTERPAIRQPYRPAGRRPQEIPNARAREDTTTRRPARNSKRARARYWRRGGRPLRVRKPKIFLGKGSKNRFRGAGAGKVGGVKNATEEENGGGFGQKKKPPMRRLMARTAVGCNMERAGARVCARGCGMRRGRRR